MTDSHNANSKGRIWFASWLLACVLSVPLASQSSQSPHFHIEELAEGVYAALPSIGGQAICNAGIVNLGSRTLIFDPFMTPAAAEDLRSAATELTGNPIKFVVNSHFHNDHIRGNQVFTEAAIISTKTTRDAILEHEPVQMEHEKKTAPDRLAAIQAALANEPDDWNRTELKLWQGYYQGLISSHQTLTTTSPQIVFENRLTIHGGARSVELIAAGGGHTDSDLILFLPGENIAFLGDLLFSGMHPWLSDGDPDNWIAILEDLLEEEYGIVVPGHGKTGDMTNIFRLIEYLKEMDALASTLIETGKTEAEISFELLPEKYKGWHLKRFFPMNMKFLMSRKQAK